MAARTTPGATHRTVTATISVTYTMRNHPRLEAALVAVLTAFLRTHTTTIKGVITSITSVAAMRSRLASREAGAGMPFRLQVEIDGADATADDYLRAEAMSTELATVTENGVTFEDRVMGRA